MSYLLAILGSVAFIALWVPAMALYHSWVATWIWLWFAVPIFHLPEVNVWQMWGLSMVFHSIKGNSMAKTDTSMDSFVGWCTSPLLTLFIGWLIHTYAM